jgi:hypothetical protein
MEKFLDIVFWACTSRFLKGTLGAATLPSMTYTYVP